VIGGLGGFVLGDPSKHMGKRVVFHNLLRQRYRSLFSVPSSSKCSCIERRSLYAFSTNLAKKHGIFNIIEIEEKRTKIEIKVKIKKGKGLWLPFLY
jgi:hypothetical protein